MSLECINFKMGFWWTSKKNYITMSTNCYLKFWIPNSKRFYFWENLSFKILSNMLISWPNIPYLSWLLWYILFILQRSPALIKSCFVVEFPTQVQIPLFKDLTECLLVACNGIASNSVIFSERYLTERNRKNYVLGNRRTNTAFPFWLCYQA